MGDSVPKHTGPISLTDTHLEPERLENPTDHHQRESSEMERPHSARHSSRLPIQWFGVELHSFLRPECCSESQRNRVRLQTGIAFTFDRIPQQPGLQALYADVTKNEGLCVRGRLRGRSVFLRAILRASIRGCCLHL